MSEPLRATHEAVAVRTCCWFCEYYARAHRTCLNPEYVYDVMADKSFDSDTKLLLLTVKDSWNQTCKQFRDVR